MLAILLGTLWGKNGFRKTRGTFQKLSLGKELQFSCRLGPSRGRPLAWLSKEPFKNGILPFHVPLLRCQLLFKSMFLSCLL